MAAAVVVVVVAAGRRGGRVLRPFMRGLLPEFNTC